MTDSEDQSAGQGAGEAESTDAPEQSGSTIERPVAPTAEELSPMLSATSDRLKDVLQVTEQAAERILDGAKVEAEKYVEAARQRTESLSRERMDSIESLTGDLLEQAGAIQRETEQLRRALSAATSQLDSELAIEEEELAAHGAPAAMRTAPPVAATTAPDEPDEIFPDSDAPSSEETSDGEDDAGSAGLFSRRRKRKPVDPDSSDGARILALQLSVAGADEEAIEARLRELGVEDTRAVLDSLDTPPVSN